MLNFLKGKPEKTKSVFDNSDLKDLENQIFEKAVEMSKWCVFDANMIAKYLLFLPYSYFINMNKTEDKEFTDNLVSASTCGLNAHDEIIKYCESVPGSEIMLELFEKELYHISNKHTELCSEWAMQIADESDSFEEVIVKSIKALDKTNEFEETGKTEDISLRKPNKTGQMFMDLCIAFFNLENS